MPGFELESMLLLFLILTLGTFIGRIHFLGVSIGTAGVLFVALIFGHFGFSVSKEIQDLGLLLFVYAVGLQAGMRFFRTFKKQGLNFIIIGFGSVFVGALATVLVAKWFNLPFDLATGLYTGALTCTPALAGVVDSIAYLGVGSAATISVGYGIAYPFSMIGVVLVVQLLPRILKRDTKSEDEAWRIEQEKENPSIATKKLKITNPNLDGKRVCDLDLHRLSTVNISRVRREDHVIAAVSTTELRLNDVLMVVGADAEIAKLSLLVGEPVEVPMDLNANVITRDVYVTESAIVGKKLIDLKMHDRFSIVITRIQRQGLEITPTGAATLEVGDRIRVVGEASALDEFVKVVAGKPSTRDETQMVTFFLGLVLGVVLGNIPITTPSGVELRLGNAGGVFIVSLIIGHLGRIGNFRLWVPNAARNITRELGLMLFLAGAGTNAGSKIAEVISQYGWSIVFAGMLITIVTVLTALLLLLRVYKMSTLATLGAMCACMTNPPGLGASQAHSESDLPTVSYASVYPAALIFKILLAQLLLQYLAVM